MDDLIEQLQRCVGDTYEIERELGGGGMSRLFIARERSLDRDVVIKLLPAELTHAVSLERFRREMAVIARLQHPHIVPIISTGASEGLSWYVMPYLRGESLRHRLERERQLPVDEGTRILREIGDALAHAHRSGIVHRDIKPANILLSDGHAVLADFGVARGNDRPSMQALGPLTDTGMTVGSPGYMAPEQLSGDPEVDARADIYALALVGYEMFTGEPPFAGLSGGALMAAHIRDTPQEPRKLRAEIPPAVNRALQTALAKDPAARFQTADEFVAALSSARVRRTPWSSRRRWTAGSAVAAAVILGAVLAMPRQAYLSGSKLDANTVAVLPFNVLAPELSVWREGMVEVLARNLDGWGVLHTVAPALSLASKPGVVDASTARSAGTRLGAGIVVFGSLFQSGPDSARVSVTVYDVAAAKAVAEFQRVEESSRLERLTDSVTVSIAAVLGRDGPARVATSLSSIGSRSLPAIKEFVQGEHYLRRAVFDSATVHFTRAAEIDSGFALAYAGIGEASGAFNDTRLSDSVKVRAGALNHGLRPRDSLVVLIDSAWGALRSARGADRHVVAMRLADALKTITTQFPSDPRGWFALGDARSHFGMLPELFSTPFTTLSAYDRAIALDSAMLRAYMNPSGLALEVGDVARARRYAQAFAAAAPDGRLTPQLRLLLWVTDERGHDDAAIRKLADTLSDVSLLGTPFWESYVDSSAVSARLMRAIDAHRTALDDVSSHARAISVPTLTAQGELRAARSITPTMANMIWRSRDDAAILAQLGVLAADSVLRPNDGKAAADAWVTRLPLWIARRDTVAIRAGAAAYIATRRKNGGADGPFVAAWMKGVAEAAVVLARGDSATGRRLLGAVPPATLALDSYLRQEIMAPLDLAQHRYAEALRELSDGSVVRFYDDPVVRMHHDVLIARAAAGAGDAFTVRTYYRKLAAMWAHADPEFGALVSEARRGAR